MSVFIFFRKLWGRSKSVFPPITLRQLMFLTTLV